MAVLVQEDGLEVERAGAAPAAERPAVARVDRHVGLVDAARRPGHAERAVGEPRPADVVEAVVALGAGALPDERRAAGGRPARRDPEVRAARRCSRASRSPPSADGAVHRLAGRVVALPDGQRVPHEPGEAELVRDGHCALIADGPVLGGPGGRALRHGDEDLDGGFLAFDVRRSDPRDDAVGSRRGRGGYEQCRRGGGCEKEPHAAAT